jgi:hypothetical protein
VQPALERAVRKAVKLQRRAALVDRLRGWWHKRVIVHLDAVARQREDRITAAELDDQLLELADSLRDGRSPSQTPIHNCTPARAAGPAAVVSADPAARVADRVFAHFFAPTGAIRTPRSRPAPERMQGWAPESA